MIRCNTSQSFNFLPIPTDIHFGFGVLRSLPDRLSSLGAGRLFLVTDTGIRSAGVLKKILDVLSEAGIGCEVYDGVKPDSGSGLIAEAPASCAKVKPKLWWG